MNRRVLFATVAALLMVGGACDSTGPSPTGEEVVVEAFLYAGESVQDIELSRAISLNSDDSVGVPISDAEVRLEKEGVMYELVPSDSSGHYHYPGNDLTVETRDVFQLEVRHNEHRITAETTVPPPPSDVALAHDTLEVSTFDGPGGGPPGGPPNEEPDSIEQNALTVTWDNPEGDYHYVVVESLVEEDPVYLLPEFIRERFSGFQFVASPTTANYYNIRSQALRVLGEHVARVYRVNEEYADLYENREQDSRDLNEPPSNVTGGLGIFSAFNSKTDTFQVVETD